MSPLAYAIEISKENLGAIASEAGRKFDREYLERWFAEHGPGGFFLRDESSQLDCELFTRDSFAALYWFRFSPETDARLFKEVIKK